MPDPSFAISVLLGLIFTGIYVKRNRKSNPAPKDIKVETIIAIFLRSGGVVGGASLMVYTFWEDISKYLSISKLHIFLGGVAVLALSIKGVWADVFPSED